MFEKLITELDLKTETYLDFGRLLKMVLAILCFILTCRWSGVQLTFKGTMAGTFLLGLFLEDPVRRRFTVDSLDRLRQYLKTSK